MWDSTLENPSLLNSDNLFVQLLVKLKEKDAKSVRKALNETPGETLQYKTSKQKLNLLISEHQNFALAR